jgi:phosphoglycolate phosphatase-like HAD superfamily hydrolase
MPPIAILDVDGTLVDTNYHHALAWHRAFRQNGVVLPLWKIHRHIGMGGDQVVRALVGDEIEEAKGDDVRAAHDALFMAGVDEIEPLEGARELIDELKELGTTVVLASSAREEELDHYLDLLGVRDLADAWTTSADVDATKPAPDLIGAALEKVGGEEGTLVGDTPWDCRAAADAGIPTIAVLTGGFPEADLVEAGAALVVPSVVELRERLDETPLVSKRPPSG